MDGSYIKNLLCKCENMCSNPQNLHKTGTQQCKSAIPGPSGKMDPAILEYAFQQQRDTVSNMAQS